MNSISKLFTHKQIAFKSAMVLIVVQGKSGFNGSLRKCFPSPLEWLLYLFLIIFTASTMAQTSVSGAIAVNTHWTSAASPYLLAADVVVQNGAVLTIDPGVTIYMGANANLTVQDGSIQAPGTSADPINVLSDKARLAQNAAAGDWNQWVFNSRAINTRLDHVVFEHGKGLAIYGSSPILNYLTIKNHQGAAISIDLAASPNGVGNKAIGNTINGIAVPAGEITTTVKWGLRGIPYFINSGTVSVGASPSITSIAPKIIQQGSTINIGMEGTRLSGLANVQFDKTGLTAEILSGATDTQVNLSVSAEQTADLGKSAMHLLVDAGEVVIADALTVVPDQPVLSNLNPSTLYLGQGLVEVEVNGSNFSSQSSILVNNTTVVSQFQSATQFKASIITPNIASNLSVKVVSPDPIHEGQQLVSNEAILPVVAGQLVISPSTITATKGFTKTLTLTLPYPAKAGGLTVDLVSSVPTVGSVPATVTIPAGQTTTTFSFTAAETGNTVITASKLAYISGQAQVSVVPPPTLTLTPNQLDVGVDRSASVTITSSVPAGDSGLTVSLNSNDTNVATVPASIVIPKGASSAVFNVTTRAIGTTLVTATANEYSIGSILVKVRPVSINLPTGVLVAPGLTRSVPLTLSDPAPSGGLVVTLTTGNAEIASVPISVTVPEGQTSANFTLTGLAAGLTTVNASAPNYQATSLQTTVETITIGIGNPAVSAITIPVDYAYNYSVTLSRPAPVGGVEVMLATSDPTKASVSPVNIVIAEGQTSGGVNLTTITGMGEGETTLTASAAGLSSAAIPITVTEKPRIFFNTDTVTVGKGLNTYIYEVYVYRAVNGQAFSGSQDLTVNLTSSDASKASIPASVTIPAGSYYTYFYVTGIDLTHNEPITIDASAAGHAAPPTKLVVSVVTPELTIQGLDNTRSTDSGLDDFYITMATPGSSYSGYQTAAVDLPINVSVVDESVSGLIPGLVDAGGNPITQGVIRAGQNSTYACCDYQLMYVGTPTTSGTYKINAQITGSSHSDSGVQTVDVAERQLHFSTSAVTVGKGLNTYIYEVYVYRAVNGQAFGANEALTVYLNCSSTVICNVPASVTIPPGSHYAHFNVEGVGQGNTTITASAVGYNSPTQDLAVNVIRSQLNFGGPSNTMVGSIQDFLVYLTTPGANYSSYQTAANDISVNLTSSAPGVATVPGSIIIPVASTNSYTTQLTGVAVGTTTLTASGSGLQSATSNVITIYP